jgi:hypothetical protein
MLAGSDACQREEGLVKTCKRGNSMTLHGGNLYKKEEILKNKLFIFISALIVAASVFLFKLFHFRKERIKNIIKY